MCFLFLNLYLFCATLPPINVDDDDDDIFSMTLRITITGAVISLHILGGAEYYFGVAEKLTNFFLIFYLYCFPNLLCGVIFANYLWFVL